MSLAAMVAGAPFFFAEGEGAGVALGGSLAAGVAVGLEEDVDGSAGVGVGEGEGFRFFLGEELGEESGVGVVGAFFFLGERDALGSGVSEVLGLGNALRFFCEEGDGDSSGAADAPGVGDLSAPSFFFGAAEVLRCFRGAGVGVGAKIFLILLPNDSSACARPTTPSSIPIKKRVPAILLTRRMEREVSTSAGDE